MSVVSPLPEPDRVGFLSSLKQAAGGLFEGLKRTILSPFGQQTEQPIISPLPEPEGRVSIPTPTPVKIDDRLLNALKQTESSNDNQAVNKKSGAMGAYQFMPQTVAYVSQLMGKSFDPFNESQARDAARFYLEYLLKRFGSIPLALAAYNAGEGNVEKYGGIPPFRETQQYIQKILEGGE